MAEIKTKDEIIKIKDQEIDFRKDLKQKLSTKMLGETLEQHCENAFNSLRATAFQQAYFEKDNNAKSGSKGDYIYKECNEDGVEIISIMFEMKNENDGTATKKKNEDFLKELDKDRTEKKCEYAVLVSVLEAESDLYTGITDVSYKYPKMYVVRPQFFIPIITLLRNAAMSSLKYKAELALVKNQSIDITNFENSINEFKAGFAKNYDLASRQFNTAINEIDKTIDHLQKTKEALPETKLADATIITPLLVQPTFKMLTETATIPRSFEKSVSAEVNYLKGKSDVRAAEMKDKDVMDLVAWIQAAQSNPKIKINSIDVKGYASPDGEETFNNNLSGARSKATRTAFMALMKKSKLTMYADTTNYVTAALGEDFEGFKVESTTGNTK